MLTIAANTAPYFLPTTVDSTNAQRVLGVLQTYYCINKCNPIDPNGYVVEVSPSGSDYLIRYYNVETGVDDDASLATALFSWNSGDGQQQPFPTFRGARAFMTANQTFSNNIPAVVDFDSETYDTDNFITPTSDTFTVSIDMAGYYVFYLSLVGVVIGGSALYFVVAEVLVNGVIEETFYTVSRDQQAGSINATVVLNIPAEATVQIQLEFQGTGATSRTLLSGSLILQHVGI